MPPLSKPQTAHSNTALCNHPPVPQPANPSDTLPSSSSTLGRMPVSSSKSGNSSLESTLAAIIYRRAEGGSTVTNYNQIIIKVHCNCNYNQNSPCSVLIPEMSHRRLLPEPSTSESEGGTCPIPRAQHTMVLMAWAQRDCPQEGLALSQPWVCWLLQGQEPGNTVCSPALPNARHTIVLMLTQE